MLSGLQEPPREPLKLEPGNDGVFLETRWWMDDGRIRHVIKDDNARGERKIWRYQHWYSDTPVTQKRAMLTACLRRVERLASDPAVLYDSAVAKVAEFRALRYPPSVLRKTCNYLGATSGNGTWTPPYAMRQPSTETV